MQLLLPNSKVCVVGVPAYLSASRAKWRSSSKFLRSANDCPGARNPLRVQPSGPGRRAKDKIAKRTRISAFGRVSTRSTAQQLERFREYAVDNQFLQSTFAYQDLSRNRQL